MELRSLSEEGIEHFRNYLTRVRQGSTEDPPLHFLQEGELTRAVAPVTNVGNLSVSTKLELARDLKSSLENLSPEQLENDRGLWAWLTLFLIEQLAPARADGSRKLLAEELYVPSMHYQRKYRHLLIGPYTVYQLYQDGARVLLSGPVHVWSDIEEQLIGVREMTRMRGAIAAADLLYFDPVTQQPKKGITNRKKGGTLRRLRAVIAQLDLTYDLYAMSGQEILDLLPSEFDRFRPSTQADAPSS